MALDIGSAPKKSSKCLPNLPHEIIDEILLLLPARSVLRFRLVCRSWAARLSSPSFTDAYAAKASARRMHKFVVFAPLAASLGCSTAVYSCSSQAASTADRLFTVAGLRADFLCLSSRLSRGLMLFSDARAVGNYWVCNPSTGECAALPPPPQHRDVTLSSAGLAVDDQTKECKVVHLFFKEGASAGVRCEVYTLGEPRRRWRPATTGLESLGLNQQSNVRRALRTEDVVTKVPPVLADGCLHWLMYPSHMGVLPAEGRDAVLRFSATDESFGFIPAPESLPLEDYVCLEEHLPAVPVHLAELKGSLCMVHDLRRRGHGASSLDIWVLRDRNAGAWSLDYRIPVTPLLARNVHSPRFITVLGCQGDFGGAGKQEQGKLLVATSEHKVYAYATDTGHVESVFSIGDTGIGLQKEAAAALWLGLYEDSLVRIGGESRREKEALSAVTEVLLRLPIKSIARSMLVCRKWRTLIQSESFVAAHMSMRRRPKRRILMATNGRAHRVFFHFIPPEIWLHAAGSGDLAGVLVNGKIICSKPCHGLNLISTVSDDYLCNPCTGAVQCLGIRGRSSFTPCYSDRQPSRHAFTAGRSIGLGFDRTTGEHVAVEIGYLCGAPACMLKTSESDAWTCAGTPPMMVTDMPAAHVGGTLYWMGAQMQAAAAHRSIVIVAFDISARAFDTLMCQQPCLNKDHCAFLVELKDTLSLVIMNRKAEEMEIWMMHDKHGVAWVEAHRICLRGQPDFSLARTMVVMPLEISGEDGRILLSTGRALGYYDTMTGALDTIYSLDHLQLPVTNLAFPMLCEESLVRVQDNDDLPIHRVGGDMDGGHRSCNHPEHAGADEEGGIPRPIFSKCRNAGCQGNGDIYSVCCKRLICDECLRRCPGHYRGQHLPLETVFGDVIDGIQRHGLPMEHPFVPDPDYYGYYYSSIGDGGVVRHVFVSLRDFVRGKQPCHLIECAYRMDGNVRETWVRRYLDFDIGQGPLR